MTELSKADRRIIVELQKDGRLSNVALAERIGMAPSPCLRRLRQLENAGYITGYAAQVDRDRLGVGITAFVELKVPQVADIAIVERFKQAVLREPSIITCYVTSGQFDFLMQVVARDMRAFSTLAQDVLLRLPGVQDMRSTFVLEPIKATTAIPLD